MPDATSRLLDPQIRALLRQRYYEWPAKTVILEELRIVGGVGMVPTVLGDRIDYRDAIADMVISTPTDLECVEIKSDGDSIARLRGQARIYSAVASKVWVATGPKLLKSVRAVVPDWWGIYEVTPHIVYGDFAQAEDSFALRVDREAAANPGPDARAVLHLLHLPEVQGIFANSGAGHPGRFPKYKLGDILAEKMTLSLIRRLVHSAFLERSWWSGRNKTLGRIKIIGGEPHFKTEPRRTIGRRRP